MTLAPKPDDREPVTFSSLGRVRACPPSAVLPAVRDLSPAPAAEVGTAVHAYLRDCNLLGPEAALARVPWEHREACEAIQIELLATLDPESFAPEVAFIYDWQADTARELDRGVDHRRYPTGPTEIAGRADVVGVTKTAVLVWDYKTGSRRLPPAEESWQLRANALAAARAYHKAEAVVYYVRFVEGRPVYLSASFDFLDLDEAATGIRETMEEISRMRSNGPNLNRLARGPHCDYCPCYYRCPAKATLFAEWMAAKGLSYELNHETVGVAHETLRQARLVLERAEEDLKGYARTRGPVPLPHGYVFGPVQVAKRKLDAVKGAIVLSREFDDRMADDAVERAPVLTLASLERALRRWKDRTGATERITTLKERVVRLLEEAGVITATYDTQVKAHKPKEPLP